MEPPEIAETEPRQAAVIPFTLLREKIREVMGPGTDKGLPDAWGEFDEWIAADRETDEDLMAPMGELVDTRPR